jgi:hypothetical protein
MPLERVPDVVLVSATFVDIRIFLLIILGGILTLGGNFYFAKFVSQNCVPK